MRAEAGRANKAEPCGQIFSKKAFLRNRSIIFFSMIGDSIESCRLDDRATPREWSQGKFALMGVLRAGAGHSVGELFQESATALKVAEVGRETSGLPKIESSIDHCTDPSGGTMMP